MSREEVFEAPFAKGEPVTYRGRAAHYEGPYTQKLSTIRFIGTDYLKVAANNEIEARDGE